MMKFENSALAIHCERHDVLSVHELENATLHESEPNHSNVFMDYTVLPISDRKDRYFCVELARHEGMYYVGYDYMCGDGGGSSAPSLYRRDKHNAYNLCDAVKSLLTRMIEIDIYKPYHKEMRDVLSIISRRQPKQLTLDLFG